MFKLTLPSFNFRSLFIAPYIILLIVGMIVPSDGGHGLLSLKSLSFVGSVISLMIYVLIYGRMNWSQVKLALFLIVSIAFLLLWMGIAIVEEGTSLASTVDQFKLLLLTLSVAIMGLYVVEEGLLSYAGFLKVIVYSGFIYSLLKLSIVFSYLIGIINLTDILSFLGVRYMTMAIFGDMTRLQTSVDIITPFLIFFVLQSDCLQVHFSRSFKWCYILVSLLSVFLSFSRFLSGVAVISLVLSWATLRPLKAAQWLVLVSVMMVAVTAWIGLDTIYSIIEVRFFSLMNAESDSVRGRQFHALLSEFNKFPVLGKGLGGYSEEVIRDAVNYHSYEVQWIAFLMQFGMIGLLFLCIPLAWVGWQIFRPPLTRMNGGFGLLYLMWLLSGFFNPFLISLTSGIVYSLFALKDRECRGINGSAISGLG